MIPPGIVVAFLIGLVLEGIAIHVLDRRAIRREAEFWEGLKEQAFEGYGRVFDWAQDPDA